MRRPWGARRTRRPGAWLVLAVGLASACGGGQAREPGAAVTVNVDAAGLTAAQVEGLAAPALEVAMGSVPHARSVRTVSMAGHAVLAVELTAGADVFQARSAIAQRLIEVSLPDGVHATLGPLSARGEVQLVLRSRAASLAELRALHEHVIAPRLRAVEGVVDVVACGGALPVIEIAVRADRLRAFDVAPEEVVSSVSREMVNVGGGVLTRDTGDVVIRGLDLAVDDLGALRVNAAADRAPILLRDVADVGDGVRWPPCQALLDGTAVVFLRVRLSSPSVTRNLEAALRELTVALPSGTELERFGRADRRGAIFGFRVATLPSDDAEALRDTAQQAARVLATADGVARVMALVGDEDGSIDRLPGEIDLVVEVQSARPPASEAQLVQLLRSVPGATVRRPTRARAARLELVLFGDDRASLAATAHQLREQVAAIAGVEVAVTIGTASVPQTSVALDRARLASLDIAPGAVADVIAMARDGLEVGHLFHGERFRPIVVRWAESGHDPRELGRLPLRAGDGSWTVLQQVASIEVSDAPLVLLRAEGRATMSVWIELAAGDASRIKAEIRRRVAGVPLPPGQLVTIE